MDRRGWILVLGCSAAACQPPSGGAGDGTTDTSSTASSAASSDATTGTTGASAGETTDDATTDATSGTDATDTGVAASCDASEPGDVVACPPSAAAPDFAIERQWAWSGEDGYGTSRITPLVANLTDDDGDGDVDLCDIPDVVVVATYDDPLTSRIYVLDGATGTPHLHTGGEFDGESSAAIGDLDGDGQSEIIAFDGDHRLVAVGNDGQVRWRSDDVAAYQGYPALADLEGDGDVEILVGGKIYDHLGQLVRTLGPGADGVSVATDLDDDGDLEIIAAGRAHQHDGTLMWSTGMGGPAHVADLDGDGAPEVAFVSGYTGVLVVAADGTERFSDPDGGWGTASIADLDGDGSVEIALAGAAGPMFSRVNQWRAIRGDGSVVWMREDAGAYGQVTAFDFYGDGSAEALVATDEWLVVLQDGAVAARVARTGGGASAIVVDVDNDGSAEIVTASSGPIFGDGEPSLRTVEVFREPDDRWVAARRIWNQHSVHATNIGEDGRLPQTEPHPWELANGFRAAAQRDGARTCVH